MHSTKVPFTGYADLIELRSRFQAPISNLLRIIRPPMLLSVVIYELEKYPAST